MNSSCFLQVLQVSFKNIKLREEENVKSFCQTKEGWRQTCYDNGSGDFKTRQRKAWHPLAGGQSWPWPLTSWPKINRVPPLIIHNLQVKFESDWAKTVVCILPKVLYIECQSWPWPLTLWPKINRVPPLIIHSLQWRLKVIGPKL